MEVESKETGVPSASQALTSALNNRGDAKFRVCIAGAGFAGAILARQLEKKHEYIEVVLFERTSASDIGASETGTGLNLNPNGMAALELLDPPLCAALRACGLPRMRMRSSTMTGQGLYDVPICTQGRDAASAAPEEDLSLHEGLRIRWRDAYTVIRGACSSCIHFGKQVESYSVEACTGLVGVQVLDVATGLRSQHSGFHLLVAADGRYSPVRRQCDGGQPPETRFAGVCNFRVLVPDTSGGLFDDMELVYNTSPSMQSLEPTLQADIKLQHCFSGFPRLGIMRMPVVTQSQAPPPLSTPTKAEEVAKLLVSTASQGSGVGSGVPSVACGEGKAVVAAPSHSLYIFGNFPVAGEVPEASRSAAVLRALYSPSSPQGAGPADAKGTFLLHTLQQHAHRLHWARMQDIPFRYRVEGCGRVLLLGDAAHAMVPTLGQGATMAMEDACVAANEITRHAALWRRDAAGVEAAGGVAGLTLRIEHRCLPRVERVSATSLWATKHLTGGGVLSSLDQDVAEWTQDGPFRDAMRDVWRGYPRTEGSGKGTQGGLGSEGEEAEAVGPATCFKDGAQPGQAVAAQPHPIALLATM